MNDASCPTCGLPPEKGYAISDAESETTAHYACPLGHLWAIRWTVYCEVCGQALEQDFNPCDPDDGPVTRCEPCDDAVCDAYEKGFKDGQRHAFRRVDGGA